MVKGFIKVFSRKALGFHMLENIFELNFMRKKLLKIVKPGRQSFSLLVTSCLVFIGASFMAD